ncbi:MAG: hypothetical protein Q8Q46_00760 [Candidatus Giovannonibacteria bacterium]|nr:hypothetical protein [Candidatus Giovannonibacteria bacterium]
MKEKIKKYIGEIMIVMGSGLFSYNIFTFSSRGGNYYYYSPESLILISVGVMLVILGILIIKKRE